MNTRLLGWGLLVASLLVMLDGVRRAALGIDQMDTVGNLVILLFSLGAIGGFLGLITLGALGSNPTWRAAGYLPIAGFVLILAADTLRFAGVVIGDPYSTVIGGGWLLVLAGTAVVGVVVAVAGAWQGYQRYVPLATILTVPLWFAFSTLVGNTQAAGIIAMSVWALLGYTIATAAPAPAVRRA